MFKSKKFASRKYTLTVWTILAATIMTAIPPLSTFWWMESALIVMTGSEWAAFVGATLLFYGGQNVVQKKYELENKSPEGE